MNADKEFAPYQPSLDMKELGFNEPCLSYYFSDGTFNDASEEDDILYPGDPRFHSDTNSSLSEYLEDELKYNAIAAPLYQQAFRWFREKYGIEGVTQRAEDFMWYKWTIYQYNENGKKYVFDWCEYETYEKAELECLKKLIEIVKNK
jgi:hypothetical protein